jgi:hypothetical protein
VPAAGTGLSVRYDIATERPDGLDALFVSEWNIAPPHTPEGDDRTARLDAGGSKIDLCQGPGFVDKVKRIEIRGSAPYALGVESDEAFDCWHFPVESISSSEGGVERVLQGFAISLVRRLRLAPGKGASFEFGWHLIEEAPR